MAETKIFKVSALPQVLVPNGIYLVSETPGVFSIKVANSAGDGILNQASEVGEINAEDIGDLSDLDTTDKTSIVNAINEVLAAGAPAWGSISGQPAYVASGADAAAARTSLGVTTAANGAHTGTTTFQVMAPDSINETAVALGAGVNIDLSAGSYFSKTITAVTTFTRSNVPASGRVGSFTLELTNGGNFTVNWFSGVKWDGGTQPALTANGIDILAFITRDGGTTWRGILSSKDSK